MSNPNPKSAESASHPQPRVLVIRGGAIGDFILTLPTIRLLREMIPNVHLEVMGYAPIIELAKFAGLAEATRSLEHASMSKLFIPDANLDPALVEYFCSFNLIVSYLYDPDGIVKGNFEKIRIKTLLEMPHQVVPNEGHAAEQLAKPLQKIAMFLDDPAPRLFAEDQAEAWRAEHVEPLVAIHPGSGSVTKNWSLDHWMDVGRELLAKDGNLQLAWITGEAEFERGVTAKIRQTFQAEISSERVLHWDHLPLPVLAKHLRKAKIFLGHDSGIGHLAAACDVPGLLLFGPTDPLVWAPKNVGMEFHKEPSGDLTKLTLEEGKALLLAFLQRHLDKK